MTSFGYVVLCYVFFILACTVTTIIIQILKKKVFNKASAYNQTQ